MITDALLLFSDAGQFDVAAATPEITDVIDLHAGKTSPSNTLTGFGVGENLYGFINVDTAFVGATATMTFRLKSDSTADLATSATTHWTSEAIPVATLAASYQLVFTLPQQDTYERYLGLHLTAATADFTAGNITAGIVRDLSVLTNYAIGQNYA